MTLAEFGTGQVFLSMLYFFLFFIWIWLLIVVFGDIFRSDDLGGWGKALWVIFVIVVPYFGVFIYLISRGHKMSEHTQESAEAQEAASGHTSRTRPVPHRARRTGPARLADLKRQGTISEAEFDRLKAQALAWTRVLLVTER